jgi:hypothetical protein
MELDRPLPQTSGRRGGLAPYLLGVLWLQGCLGAGMLLSPLVAGWRLPSAKPDAPGTRLAYLRQSMCDPARDPKPGSEVSLAGLTTLSGARLDPRALEGRTLLILFAKPGGG